MIIGDLNFQRLIVVTVRANINEIVRKIMRNAKKILIKTRDIIVIMTLILNIIDVKAEVALLSNEVDVHRALLKKRNIRKRTG